MNDEGPGRSNIEFSESLRSPYRLSEDRYQEQKPADAF